MSPPSTKSVEFLGGLPAFRGLPADLLTAMLDRMEERTFASGELLLRQNDTGNHLLVLSEGSADVSVRQGEDTHRSIGRVGAGEVVGEMALLTGERRGADVRALEPVRALALAAEEFDRLARRNPQLGVVLTNLIADRLGSTSGDVLGGKTLEGYRIERCVGRGGMAIVYEARSEKDDTQVALKMMSHRLVYDAAALARFRQEAETVESLDHPNIARVFGRFSAFGTHFLVMEFLDGIPLDRIRAEGKKLSETQTRRVIGQLAAALGYVHARGMVHRDIKPSNLIVTRAGELKLMDFGLVRPLLPTDDRTVTHEMSVVGTPSYMAPEQFSDDGIDHRVDIYAVGCLALTLLTGDRVFRASNLLDMIRRKLAFELPPAAEIGDGISAEMHDFIRRAMQTKPDERIDTLEPYHEWAGPVELPV
jgi:serine/threonine protein kinase